MTLSKLYRGYLVITDIHNSVCRVWSPYARIAEIGHTYKDTWRITSVSHTVANVLSKEFDELSDAVDAVIDSHGGFRAQQHTIGSYVTIANKNQHAQTQIKSFYS